MIFNSDHIGSDDLDAILDLSREGHEITMSEPHSRPAQRPILSEKYALNERLAQFDTEIAKHEKDIRELQNLVAHRKKERQKVLEDLQALSRPVNTEKGKGKQGIDYGSEVFEWTDSLKGRMKAVFGIDDFRLCQRGVCNANMDGRDIVCVMPTGGGKSLTYQLPALLQPGCTLVISPLISLITDQVLHLEEAGVQAVKLTGGTSKAEASEITSRLLALAAKKVKSSEEIKLCYVTPEKIAKSKTFVSHLQKLANASQLARIVIDEAHCVSQLGHDFRPDYQKLHVLRQLFPRVPIMALSATCPPKVLEDILKTLNLKKVVNGNNASPEGTAYFTAPLYRKNLHYKILSKPSKASDVLQVMVDYIMEHHPGDSGIVYCLSKKDAENVAQGLYELSGNKIKTGVYHADRSDGDKERLHIAWRRGSIKVVCATIAFGLGIDKGDVRFVLHHSLSKSVEGFYQESGRAGRDGKDSDCVLYYRPQDGTTLSSMVAGEKEGRSKPSIEWTDPVHAMLAFAQNLQECRKLQFAKYFSHSSQLAMSAWSTGDSDALAQCGHCDNCTRGPEEVECKDVTVQAWQLVKITQALNNEGANITLNSLAALARGNGGGAYEVTRGGKTGKGKGKAKEKQTLDLDAIAGGTVDLTKDEIEHLLVELIIKQYLAEKYQQTAYSTNVYVTGGPIAPALSRHTRESIATARGVNVEYAFRKRPTKAKAKAPSSSRKPGSSTGKRKRVAPDSDDDEHEEIDIFQDDDDGDEDDDSIIIEPQTQKGASPRHFALSEEDSDDGDEIDGDWQVSIRKKGPPPSKRTRSSGSRTAPPGNLKGKVITENDRAVIVLSESD